MSTTRPITLNFPRSFIKQSTMKEVATRLAYRHPARRSAMLGFATRGLANLVFLFGVTAMFVYEHANAEIYNTLLPSGSSSSQRLNAVAQLSAPESDAERLQNQRYHYELAKAKLKKGDVNGFKINKALVGDYPLKPYLEYHFALKHFAPLDKQVIEQFLKDHNNTYLGDRLQKRYLSVLARHKSWEDLLYWYRSDISTSALRCQWLEARTQQGELAALAEVGDLWVSAKSHPKDCDNLFALWKQSDHYNASRNWDRFMLALEKRKRGLARYLASTLPSEYEHYVQKAWTLDQRPHLVSDLSQFNIYTNETQQLIAFATKRYARRHPVNALRSWEKHEASKIFDDEIAKTAKISLIHALLRKGHIAEAEQIVRHSPSVRQSNAIERLIRNHLKEKRWQDTLNTIALLPEDKQNSDRWRYWHTRALEESKQISSNQARSRYETLAKKRSFYGFLSADIVGKPYQLGNQPVDFPLNVLDTIEQRPAILRAKELWLVGHLSEARAEWMYGTQNLSARELAAAGALAHNWGWYDRAIHTMIAGKHWNHLDIRFPLAYKEHVVNAAQQKQLPPSLIFAIARQESAMSEQAHSSAGARGLMQLMPATAKETARKAGIRHQLQDLYQAEHNIALGSAYLDELLERFNGNRILAAAAYNAGPHRVNRWSDSQKDLAFDVWIETIPFNETRGYVQNVLTFAVIYSFKMGTPSALITKSEANQLL